MVSLDAAKALNMIEWEYLWECLHRYGFRHKFITWLQLLYKVPVARIQVHGRISDPFPLSRGTRQGCPRS